MTAKSARRPRRAPVQPDPAPQGSHHAPEPSPAASEALSEPFDPVKIAAECKAAADGKVKRAYRRRHKHDAPPLETVSAEKPGDPPKREGRDETGRYAKGHSLTPAFAHGKADPAMHDKYKPEYAEQARKIAQLGATQAEIADFFEVAESTIKYWRHQHPEFEEAVQIGREPANRRTERSLYDRANGYAYKEEVAIKVKVGKDEERVEVVELAKFEPPETRAIELFLSNRMPDQYRVRREHVHSGTVRHVPSPAEARAELADFLRREQTMIDVTPKLPDLGGEADRDGDF